MVAPFDIQDLVTGRRVLCISGLGFIGYSAAIYYAYRGVSCVGIDPDPAVAKAVGEGRCPVPNLTPWLEVNGLDPRISFPVFSSLTDPQFVRDFAERTLVHKICVPTEKDGRIDHGIVKQVCGTAITQLHRRNRPLLIDIESTVSPSALVHEIYPLFQRHPLVWLSVSPRRDWFVSSERDLQRLPRVVGGMTPEAADAARQVNELVCDKVVLATGAPEAAATKALENTLRNVCLRTVNELARRCPQLDVREIARLVATKWNMGLYEPSIGIGGYCIPLGPAYLLEDSSDVAQGLDHIDAVTQAVVNSQLVPVTLLGLTYRGDVPVFKSSPMMRIAEGLQDKIPFVLSDPYLKDSVPFPESLKGSKLIIVGAGHVRYRNLPLAQLFQHLSSCRVLLDNEGVFAHVPAQVWTAHKIRYLRPGEKGWLQFKT